MRYMLTACLLNYLRPAPKSEKHAYNIRNYKYKKNTTRACHAVEAR